jgi:uncharacterized membrane protein YhaH (DUF805 family)
MEWMLLPLKRYADFQGRSRRMEYWMFVLGILIVEVVVFALFGVLGAFSPSASGTMSPMFWPMFGLLGILGLAIIVPSIAVQVRRFHDQNLTGWLVLLSLIPYLGGFVVLVFMCLPGTKGPNKFGPDPLDPNGANVADVFR